MKTNPPQIVDSAPVSVAEIDQTIINSPPIVSAIPKNKIKFFDSENFLRVATKKLFSIKIAAEERYPIIANMKIIISAKVI